MSKVQIIIVVLLGLILAAIAIPFGLSFWGARGDSQFFHNGLGSPRRITDFDREMIERGYLLNSEDNRWYPAGEPIADGCTATGTRLNATLTNCKQPLTGGIPNRGE